MKNEKMRSEMKTKEEDVYMWWMEKTTRDSKRKTGTDKKKDDK